MIRITSTKLTAIVMAALLLSTFSGLSRVYAQGSPVTERSSSGIAGNGADACGWVWDGEQWVKICI